VRKIRLRVSFGIACDLKTMIASARSLLFWRNAVYWISGGADFLPPSLSFRHSSLSCQINRFPTSMRHRHRALPPRYSRITSDRCYIRCALSFSKASSSRWIYWCRCFFVISGYLISKIFINENEIRCIFYIAILQAPCKTNFYGALCYVVLCIVGWIFLSFPGWLSPRKECLPRSA
jgi:hypothetical protein